MKDRFVHINETYLRQFVEQVFLAIGCPAPDASLAADVLLQADLRGVDSHGVARLAGYIRLWEKGRINASPKIKIIHESPTTATVDGDRGLGLVVAPWAMQVALNKAKQYGCGFVAVKNSNHFGIAAYHAMMALAEDMIGFASTNASPLVTPTFSKERMLGTNPICYAFPAGKQQPIVVDMATSAAANGKLEIAQRLGTEIPQGWAQTKEGWPTTDAQALKNGGSLLPLGSDKQHGSHKGYGLGAIVDILTAVLSGANYGPWAPPFVAFLEPAPDPVGTGLGHFVGAWRVDGFRPVDEFKRHMDNWIQRFKQAEPIAPDQKVIIPGEPEMWHTDKRKKEGIPLDATVIASLREVAKDLDLKFKL